MKIPPSYQFLHSILKNSKVTKPSMFPLWRHYVVIQALNLETNTILKTTGKNNPCHWILTLCTEKHQSYKAFINYILWRHIDDVIQALNLKIKGSVIFYWEGGLWKFFKFCKFLVIPPHLIIKADELVSVLEAETDNSLGLLKVKAGNLRGI